MIRLSFAIILALAASARAAELSAAAAAKTDPKKIAEYMKEVEKGAAGDVNKQTLLGIMNQHGIGMPKNPAKALEILTMAAERGYALAQTGLGLGYLSGSWGKKDMAEAARWLEAAAEQGYTDAQANVAIQAIPVEGERPPGAFPEDAEKTYFWSSVLMLANGPKDVPEIRKMMINRLPPERIAALDARLLAWEPKQGLAWKGQRGIAPYACFPCVRRLADDGEADAQWMMGNLYANGIVLPKDPAQAFAWYRRSAEQGDLESQRKVAEAYFFGEGVSENYEEAYFWIGFVADAATNEGWYDKDIKLHMVVEETHNKIEKSRREDIEAKWKAWKPVLEKKAAKPKAP